MISLFKMISIANYFDKMKNIQRNILGILDKKQIKEEDWNKLFRLLDETKVTQDSNEFKSFLHMISIISTNYMNTEFIFPRIEKILLKYKEEMLNYLSNNELFTVFKRNKRCLLFLFQEKILSPNRYIVKCMKKYEGHNYIKYFYQEIQEYILNDDGIEIEENFKQLSEIDEQKRKIGENDNEICLLIRNDSLKEFINFINRHRINLSSKIAFSIFETNSFLLKNTPTLIKYAAFYGSLQIFKYLYSEKVNFDQKIFLFAVHGGNLEIIHLIEKRIHKKEIDINGIYFESLKCHRNNICRYFENSYTINTRIHDFLKSYNFKYFTIDFLNEPDIFYELCHYDYSIVANILLKIKHPQIQLKCKQNIILVCVQKCNIEILKSLLNKKEYDVNAKSIVTLKNAKNYQEFSALNAAVNSENEEIIPILLNHESINVNSICTTKLFEKEGTLIVKKAPLISAIQFGNIIITKMLLDHKRIDVNIDDVINLNDWMITKMTVLSSAIVEGNSEIVQILLNRNDINVNRKTITSFNEKDFSKKIIENSVLHYAIQKNNLEIIKLLIDSNKIDVNLPEKISSSFIAEAIKSLGSIILGLIVFCILNKFINRRYYFVLLGILMIYVCITNHFFFL